MKLSIVIAGNEKVDIGKAVTAMFPHAVWPMSMDLDMEAHLNEKERLLCREVLDVRGLGAFKGAFKPENHGSGVLRLTMLSRARAATQCGVLLASLDSIHPACTGSYLSWLASIGPVVLGTYRINYGVIRSLLEGHHGDALSIDRDLEVLALGDSGSAVEEMSASASNSPYIVRRLPASRWHEMEDGMEWLRS